MDGGGLKLIDLRTRVQVNMLQWVRRLLKFPEMNVGITLRYLLKKDDLKRFLSFRKPPIPPDILNHQFYDSMFSTYNRFHDFEPVNEDAIREEFLWHNPQVGGKNAPIFWPHWARAGISKLAHVCHATEGRLLSHLEISEKHKIKCSFLEALSMRLQVPQYWKDALSNNWRPPPLPGSGISLYIQKEEQPIDIEALSAKGMYARIITIRSKTNAAFQKWIKGEDDLGTTDQREWGDICQRAFSSCRETKLQSFQYRVINRILPCQVFLKRIKISDTDECPFCGDRDTIAHYLAHCTVVSSFWDRICSWFRDAADLYLDQLSTKERVFGLPKECHQSRVINFILLHIRFYIYRQKLYHEGRLDLTQWLAEFKTKLKVEQWISKRMGTPASFQCWRGILNELG